VGREEWPCGILTGATPPAILEAHAEAAIRHDNHRAVVPNLLKLGGHWSDRHNSA
jgi:hypothetical protein